MDAKLELDRLLQCCMVPITRSQWGAWLDDNIDEFRQRMQSASTDRRKQNSRSAACFLDIIFLIQIHVSTIFQNLLFAPQAMKQILLHLAANTNHSQQAANINQLIDSQLRLGLSLSLSLFRYCLCLLVPMTVYVYVLPTTQRGTFMAAQSRAVFFVGPACIIIIHKQGLQYSAVQ